MHWADDESDPAASVTDPLSSSIPSEDNASTRMFQNTQLSLLIEVVEYVQDDNGVDAAEVGIGDVCQTSNSALLPKASRARHNQSRACNSMPLMRSGAVAPAIPWATRAGRFVISALGSIQPRRQQALTTAEIQNPLPPCQQPLPENARKRRGRPAISHEL